MVVINHAQSQVAQPSLPPQQIALQARIFGEVNEALKRDIARLQNDFVTVGFERSGQPAQSFRNALFNRNAKCAANLVAEETNGSSGVYFGGDIVAYPSGNQRNLDGNTVVIISVDKLFGKVELCHGCQIPI